MTRLFPLAILVLFLAAISPAAFGEARADLWRDAVASYADNEEWEAGLIRISFVQFNRRDEEISSSETLLRIAVNEDGELVTTVVESYQDGEQRDSDSDSSGGPPFGDDGNAFAVLQTSPFDPAMQDRVSVQPTSRARSIGGMKTLGFDYVLAGEDSRSAVGTAWLSADGGRPILVEVSIDPLPSYLQSFVATQRYSGTDERWTTETLVFRADVRFFLIRRRIESSMKLSEYFRYRE